MKDQVELLKIGDFAQLAGTNLRTLRYYEELGLLTPAARSQGKFRYYRPTDVNRVRFIRDLQELGLHLDSIRELAGPRLESESREAFLGRVREALLEHERLLDERRRDLEEQRDRVSAALERLAVCDSCPHSPSPENNHCEPCAKIGTQLPDLLSALF